MLLEKSLSGMFLKGHPFNSIKLQKLVLSPVLTLINESSSKLPQSCTMECATS